jgi:hypothetical protein
MPPAPLSGTPELLVYPNALSEYYNDRRAAQRLPAGHGGGGVRFAKVRGMKRTGAMAYNNQTGANNHD